MTATRIWFGALPVCAFALSPAVPAAAAPHRARLSADLADHLQAGTQTIDVIVHGSRTTVDGLARQDNLTVRKYLREGAVLRITAGQLAALAADKSRITSRPTAAPRPVTSGENECADDVGAAAARCGR